MQVKRAFTLVELLVSIILLSILFALVLNGYINKNGAYSDNFKDMIFKIVSKKTKEIIIYSQNCQKGMIIYNNGKKKKITNLKTGIDDAVYRMERYKEFKKIEFEDEKIDSKFQKICMKIDIKNGRFIDKLIVKKSKKYYLFLPFYQEISKFDTLEKAEKAYINETPLSFSEEGYMYE